MHGTIGKDEREDRAARKAKAERWGKIIGRVVGHVGFAFCLFHYFGWWGVATFEFGFLATPNWWWVRE